MANVEHKIGSNDNFAQRQSAILEILEAIDQSPENANAVFDAILRNATSLCNTPFANLNILDESGNYLEFVREWGNSLKHFKPGWRWALDTPLAIARAVREKSIIHIEDITDTVEYREGNKNRKKLADDEGIRTFLAVPLISNGIALGSIGLFRREVLPFSDGDIELIGTFAQQAVIAIKNVQQYHEIQGKLERETATKNILEIIGQSRDDDGPVFDSILESAARLCDAERTVLMLVNEEKSCIESKRVFGLELPKALAPTAWPLESLHLPSQAVASGKPVHLPDVRLGELYKLADPTQTALVEEIGLRTVLAVPLLRDKRAVGVIMLNRLNEARPFSDNDIRLIETFAEQAVIAIDNAQLLRDLKSRLEREAANRNILQVISRSRDDDTPVFDTVLENAARLCSAPSARLMLTNDSASHFTVAASWGEHLPGVEVGETTPLDPELSISICIASAKAIHQDDLRDSAAYKSGNLTAKRIAEQQGVRTILFVPLISQDRVIGCIALSKLEVAPFRAEDVELVEVFAAQAVIAIENTSQFRELQSLNAELSDRVAEQVSEIERMARLKRFLPAAVADTVIGKGAEQMLSSHRSLLGVLFCDIRGFTAFCETAEPEETIEVLQTYHEEMGKLIAAHGAGVDHRMGDGIMVLFNDPLPCDDPAGDAVRLAVAMRRRMLELCKKWKRLGHRLGFGVGISLGYATVGMVGYEGRYDYTASGTAVNLAARLCDLAEDGEILLSPRANTAVEDDITSEPTGEVTLKGISAPVEVFRLLDEST